LKTVEQFSAAGRLNLPVAKLACCYALTGGATDLSVAHFGRTFFE